MHRTFSSGIALQSGRRAPRGPRAARRGSARAWVSLSLLVLCAGAAAVVWLGRFRGDSTEAATAYVQTLIAAAERGATGPAAGPSVGGAAARPGGPGGVELAELVQRAGGDIKIRVEEKGSDLAAVVSNDIGDVVRLRLEPQGRGGFRVLGTERVATARGAEQSAGSTRPTSGVAPIGPPRTGER